MEVLDDSESHGVHMCRSAHPFDLTRERCET
jgi:hypothetical protein